MPPGCDAPGGLGDDPASLASSICWMPHPQPGLALGGPGHSQLLSSAVLASGSLPPPQPQRAGSGLCTRRCTLTKTLPQTPRR